MFIVCINMGSIARECRIAPSSVVRIVKAGIPSHKINSKNKAKSTKKSGEAYETKCKKATHNTSYFAQTARTKPEFSSVRELVLESAWYKLQYCHRKDGHTLPSQAQVLLSPDWKARLDDQERCSAPHTDRNVVQFGQKQGNCLISKSSSKIVCYCISFVCKR